ncbi:MAG: VanZ family protein [Planctomycetota bacterium]
MPRPPRSDNVGQVLRRTPELLSVLIVLFIAQAGLVPLDIGASGPGTALTKVFSAEPEVVSFPDIVANLFLFVPFGAVLHWTLSRRNGRAGFALLTTVGCAAALSGTIEWLQAFSPSRVSSAVDLLCNVLGALIGVVLAWVARGIVPKLIGALLWELRQRPASATLRAYCGLLVLFAALPFSVSYDRARLNQAFTSAVWVPFASASADEQLLRSAATNGEASVKAHLLWQDMKRWSRWGAEAASFALLVWLAFPIFRFEYRFSPRGATALIWWFCGALAIALSLLQFAIVSRGLDVTDILFRWSGIGLGLLTRTTYLRRRDMEDEAARERRGLRLATLGGYATAAFIIYNGIIPLIFDVSASRAAAALHSDAFLPFLSYFVTRFDVMITDVAEKVGSYAVLAAFMVAGNPRLRRFPAAERLIYVVPRCVVLSAAIEAVQMFSPVRITSLTDPILAAAGCTLGVILHVHAAALRDFAATHEMLGPNEQRPTTGQGRRPSLSDRLLSTLMDSSETAPQEPASATPEGLRPTP